MGMKQRMSRLHQRRRRQAFADGPSASRDARYDTLKQLLLRERAKFAEQFGRLRENLKERPTEGVDDEEAASASVCVHTASREVSFLSDMAQKVDAALQALEDGTYGICVGCDTEIPEARLQALPYAQKCLSCAQLAENLAGGERGGNRTNRGPHAGRP
jgi:DnaK suppressor protein